MKVVHFTTSHDHKDARIFLRECCSLAAWGFQTHLIAPGAPEAKIKGVYIHKTPKFGSGILTRSIKGVMIIIGMLRNIKADVYHFHDFGLIPVGLLLKITGSKIVYDVHEDFPRVVLDREYIPKSFHRFVSKFVESVEAFSAKYFDGIVTVNQSIKIRFDRIGCPVVIATNYPDLSSSYFSVVDWSQKERAVCYCGGLNKTLGLFTIINSIKHIDAKLLLAGWFSPSYQREQAEEMTSWSQVEYLGHISRKEVNKVYERSMAGLVLYLPSGNTIDAMPNKMFEYMAAGIPVIASNFPVWKKIIEGNECGVCVDPLDEIQVARTIQWILDNPTEAKRMGVNGRRIVEEKFNWRIESKKLLSFYQLLGV
jgi:glycosyltransferase involved in cell wall biosynthesis